jgi:hypothetical protein
MDLLSLGMSRDEDSGDRTSRDPLRVSSRLVSCPSLSVKCFRILGTASAKDITSTTLACGADLSFMPHASCMTQTGAPTTSSSVLPHRENEL